MGQGQPSVIIWTTLVVLSYMMLHTKFQGHWSIGSGEEDFLRFLPYMGMAAMLVMWPKPFEQLFFPKGPGGCIWNLVAIGPVVSEEKSFEIVDGRRTDGRTDDGRTTDDGACLYYKLPRSLRLRWAKNPSSWSERIKRFKMAAIIRFDLDISKMTVQGGGCTITVVVQNEIQIHQQKRRKAYLYRQ